MDRRQFLGAAGGLLVANSTALASETRLAVVYAIVDGKATLARRRHTGPEGLLEFVKDFWPILEPQTKFVDGWPLKAVCEHLQAVTAGKITRLLINVPPGFMKSLLTDVFWPAWEWGPMGLSHLRYVTFSYSASLTERDNRRFGDLVSSPEYQEIYGDKVAIRKLGEHIVSNSAMGWKLASSVGGVATGERGDRVILDDPHSVKEAESDIVRQETVRWFRESMSNRLNDMVTGAIVIIMQRVQQEDVSGVILEERMQYEHVMIPMEYDPEYQVDQDGDPVTTSIGWTDPRYQDDLDEATGQLAWPERFPPKQCKELESDIGPYAWAGQYQQTPTVRGGAIFRTEWWQLWEPPDGKFPAFDYLLASLDSAFTQKEENDPSGFTIWGVFTHDGNQRIMLVHAWRKHLAFSGPRLEQETSESKQAWVLRTQKTWGLLEWIVYSCQRFKVDKLLIEGKANGISAAQELRNRYGDQNFAVQLCPVRGDKVSRAHATQPVFSKLYVWAPARDWAEMVIEEMAVFPKGRYDDLTDSTTQAIKYLRDNGMAGTDQEMRDRELASLMAQPVKSRALYPV